MGVGLPRDRVGERSGSRPLPLPVRRGFSGGFWRGASDPRTSARVRTPCCRLSTGFRSGRQGWE